MISLGMMASLSDGFGISLIIPFLQTLQEPEQSSPITGNFFIDALNQLFTSIPVGTRILAIPACILLSILLKNLINYSNALLFSWLNSRISHRLRSQVFNQILTVSYSFLERSESGKIINILATESWQTSRALSVFVSLITNACTITVLVALLLLISWRLTLIVGFAILLISQFIQLATSPMNDLGKKAVEANSQLATRMWEGLAGMRVIRSFGRESYEQERFDCASQEVRDTFLKLDVIPENLARCLKSLIPLQTAGDSQLFEIIVVDNAPSDERTKQLVSSLPSVRYTREVKPGLDFARNCALQTATGELLAFLDDDVVVDSQWLKGLQEAWAENPDAGGFTGLVLPYELDTEAQIVFEKRGGFRRGFEKIR